MVRNLETLIRDLKKLNGNSFGGSRTLKNYTPKRKRNENEITNPCGICMSEIDQIDVTALYTPCHHLFHRDCLCPWLMRNQTCPICRTSFSEAQVNSMCPPDRYGRPTIKKTKVFGEPRRSNIRMESGPNAVSIDWDGNIIRR